ncbi:MAG: flagellin [Bryobacteraceae bacterium]
MSLSVNTNINAPGAQNNVQANPAQRPPANQEKVPDGNSSRRDAVSLTPLPSPSPPAAQSQIRDAATATDAANRAKTQMYEQPSAGVMAQAHASPQGVLAALRA